MKTILTWEYEPYSFEFIEDSVVPPDELITCTFWFVQVKDKICLTKNYRGWEFPGWHREKWESLMDALKREIREEVWAEIADIELFGYKKITNKTRQKNRDGSYYPFPHSYIVFYNATTQSIDKQLLCPESFDAQICSYEEARELMNSEHNKIVLDYIYNK